MRAIVSFGSWSVMLIGGGLAPFADAGVRLVFSGVAGRQALMRLVLQWDCWLWCCFLRRNGGGGACPSVIVFVHGYR